MYEIRKRKNEIRDKYRELRHALDPAVKAEMDAKICETFTLSATYRYAAVLLLYAPKSDEVNVLPIAKKALEDGKKVAFPRCFSDTYDMDFHFVENLDQLEPGAYGLLEPPDSLPIYDRASILSAACVVPALVYDKKGFRLGYGKGYYDRYLGSFSGAKVGLVYSSFIIDEVPRGRFDLSVDFIVTERGIRVK